MRRAAPLVLAAMLAAGCGSSSRDPAGGASATTPAAAAITIGAPADGARLKARETGGGALRAPVRVRGRAQPGSTVYLSASCRPASCRAQATAGRDGGWAVTLRLRTPRANAFVTIDANTQRDVVAADSAVATVELVAPPRRRSPRAAEGLRSRAGRGELPEPPRRSLPRNVLVIGDSLALGIEQPLKAALAGWRVHVDGRIGRPLAEGMAILGRQSAPPAVLAFSLFTNDDPRNTRALESAVRSTAGRPGGCAVWATVVRPPLNGVSYDAANALLRRLGDDRELALGLQLVDWAAEVARSPSLIAGDNVHPTPAGYGALGELYAAAIRSCAGTS